MTCSSIYYALISFLIWITVGPCALCLNLESLMRDMRRTYSYAGNKIFIHCMQMSNSIEKGKVYDVGFHWGKKRERRVTTEEVHYESFTYDGVEYFLYDCVYFHKEGEPEPYIGKLIRIWEHPNEGRRVLVLWFFRPSDISNYLGCQHVLENELFLACGNGVGLANENSLVMYLRPYDYISCYASLWIIVCQIFLSYSF